VNQRVCWREEDRPGSPNHGVLSQTIRQSNSGTELFPAWIRVARLGNLKGPLTPGYRFDPIEIEETDLAELIGVGRCVLVAKPKVSCEFSGELDVVLNIESIIFVRDHQSRVETNAIRDGNPQEETGEAAAGSRASLERVRTLGIQTIEKVRARWAVCGRAVEPDQLEVCSNLDLVPVSQEGKVILELPVVRRGKRLVPTRQAVDFERGSSLYRQTRTGRVLRDANSGECIVPYGIDKTGWKP